MPIAQGRALTQEIGMLNKLQIIGRVGRDPEIRYTSSGKAVCSMSVATTQTWKDARGDRQEETEWHRVTIWGVQAEFAEKYVAKGGLVYVEGRIKTNKWEDNDGNTRYDKDLVASDLKVLDGWKDSKRRDDSGNDRPKRKSPGRQESYEDSRQKSFDDDFDDDIPF